MTYLEICSIKENHDGYRRSEKSYKGERVQT